MSSRTRVASQKRHAKSETPSFVKYCQTDDLEEEEEADAEEIDDDSSDRGVFRDPSEEGTPEEGNRFREGSIGQAGEGRGARGGEERRRIEFPG